MATSEKGTFVASKAINATTAPPTGTDISDGAVNPAADGGGVGADRAFPLEDDGLVAQASAQNNAFPLEDDGVAADSSARTSAHPEDRGWRVAQVGVGVER